MTSDFSAHLWNRPICGNRPSCGTQPSCESYIFKEDNVFSMIASLPYSPPVNTDIDYYQTFFLSFVRVAMQVVRQFLGEEKPVLDL